MGEKKTEDLGDRAISNFFEQPEGLPEIERTKVGRRRTIYREYEKSSQEGLREGYTRATFIVREDLLKKLKDYAYTEREKIKDVVNKMLAEFLEDKEVIEREDK